MDSISSLKRAARSPHGSRASTKSRRTGPDGASRESSRDPEERSQAGTHASSHDRTNAAINTPPQRTYAWAIREVLGLRALGKDEIIKEVLERHAEWFPARLPETVRAGLHTTFSNHSKSKDPKIREWAREWAREGGHTSERARTIVWTRAEVDLPAEVPASTVECYLATARTDSQDNGPAVQAHTAIHTSRLQDRSLQSSNTGSRGSTQHIDSPRTPSAPPPRALALGNGQLHLSNILSHPPPHPDHPPSISGIDSHQVQVVPPPLPSSSEEAVEHIAARASLNETLPKTGSDKTQSTQTPDPEQSPRPRSPGNPRLTPQLLDWGSEVGRIREMMSQLEERKMRKTTISREAQELQQKKEEAVAVAVQLEAEVKEARKRVTAASQEAEEFENEVKKRTAILLGSVS
ncbi:hypothetical protein LTR56_026976 [Elasticomyces elasticus]|nr:hypothetical protein LTR56_026976 [Elasticomyces elasticus]KAK4908464.1 hypothetical protein LTR49_022670 [Elasticomyces elasticus]KAK5735709.1 hypothetical protein LTS12_026391 [Elasticomyces elasticus]